MEEIFLKLRNNIVLESDLQLAEREIQSLFDECRQVHSDSVATISAIPPQHLLSNTKQDGVIGYLVKRPRLPFSRIAQLLSFTQEIWTDNPVDCATEKYCVRVDNLYCIVPVMAMSEILFYTKTPSIITAQNIIYYLANNTNADADIKKAIGRAKTSASHVHSFHTYKAKFFPRFVHSLIVSNCDITKRDLNVCDPFVGSGTTLIESALMGYRSYGIDIDALSCFISEIKCKALEMDSSEINQGVDEGLFHKKGDNHYEFPEEIVKKFRRWNSLEEMEIYQNEISDVLNQIDNEDSPYKDLHRIALSDALTRKFNIRMMGTGSGRFALEIGKTSLASIIKSDIVNEIKAVKTINILKSIYGLTIVPPVVVNGSATLRSMPDKSVDVIITSPPYIPASSGREDYLTGKLISLKAMGLYNADSVEFTKKNSVGSMSVGSEELAEMPASVIELYQWLLADELRNIKARPIIAYYQSIIAALREDARTIKDDGRIVYIIGKETIFYNSSSKEILYKVDCDKIFIEIATSIGLIVEDVINIELDKKDNIARPRGSDKYYECAIIMKKQN